MSASKTTYDHYMAALRKSWLVIVLIALIAAFLAGAAATHTGTAYSLHYSYSVSLAERETPPEYTFDGFYALQATDLFSATLARWITAPEIVAAAYEQAGLPQVADARVLSRQVRAEKTAPQLVQVTITGKNPNEIRKLAQGMRAVITDNVEQYHDEGIPALRFAVVVTDEWVGERPVATTLVSIATFIAALLLAVNAVLLRESLKMGTAK